MVKFEPHPLAYASWCRRGSKLEIVSLIPVCEVQNVIRGGRKLKDQHTPCSPDLTGMGVKGLELNQVFTKSLFMQYIQL